MNSSFQRVFATSRRALAWRKFRRSIFLLATIAFTLTTDHALSAEPRGRPHIVVFLADDHSFLDSEVYGARDLRTPNMLRLAASGKTFTHAFVASPSCAPSRAAMLTGLMPARNGAEANHAKPRAEIKKLPAYLKELGYEVAAFGKVSHYKHTADYGFDHYAHDGFHEHQAIPAALKWLRERKSDKPLCLFVGSNWPHVPWPESNTPSDAAAVTLPLTQVNTPETRRARKLYCAAVTRMDEELGLVLGAARERLGTNVLFLMTSDHGSQFPFGKWNCYDAGIRVPLLVLWPGVIKPGLRTEAMVSWVDILPTLIEVAGGQPPASIDGRSFASVLHGRATEFRDRIFTTHSADGKMNVYPMRSLRTRDWKLILNLHPDFQFTTHIDLAPTGDKPGYWGGYWESWIRAAETNAAAAAQVKRYHHRPAVELYDLRGDPHEQHNLAGDPAQAIRAKQMRAELESWMRDQGDQQRVYGTPK
jgi:N-sulfoglucosamine sulfohydrolase